MEPPPERWGDGTFWLLWPLNEGDPASTIAEPAGEDAIAAKYVDHFRPRT